MNAFYKSATHKKAVLLHFYPKFPQCKPLYFHHPLVEELQTNEYHKHFAIPL